MRTWVVGGTSGIGEAVASRLRDDNHTVFASGVEIDVRQRIPSDAARLDWVVYSAGTNWLDWLQDIQPDEMLEIFDVNCVGLVRVLQAATSAKRVVVIGSDAAWKPMRTSIIYNASKAALHETVRCVARERASEDFAINVVAPGLTDTHMTEYVAERTREIRPGLDLTSYMLDQIPLGRAARPAEIAEVVCAVLNLETPYLNGAIIPVNGAR